MPRSETRPSVLGFNLAGAVSQVRYTDACCRREARFAHAAFAAEQTPRRLIEMGRQHKTAGPGFYRCSLSASLHIGRLPPQRNEGVARSPTQLQL